MKILFIYLGICAGAVLVDAEQPAPSPTRASINTSSATLSIAQAVQTLHDSTDPETLITAATAIAASADDDAWNVLKNFLTSSDLLKPFTEATKPTVAVGASTTSDSHPQYFRLLSAALSGTPSHANAAFIWLVDQPIYDESKADTGWHGILLYDALQNLKQPDAKVMEVLRKKLFEGNTDAGCKGLITNALAAYSTPESLKLYGEYDGYSGSSRVYLLYHRDKPATLKRFVERYASMTEESEAMTDINGLLSGVLEVHGGPSRPLPPWPAGVASAQIADTLESFLSASVKVPLTENQRSKFQDLIKKLRGPETTTVPASQK